MRGGQAPNEPIRRPRFVTIESETAHWRLPIGNVEGPGEDRLAVRRTGEPIGIVAEIESCLCGMSPLRTLRFLLFQSFPTFPEWTEELY